MLSTKKTANRLIKEKSPYLLQHAYNPVDWYPWSEEAFQRAKEEDKPVFLSIGYSTCHWCHVMERESFEDDKVAKKLNKDFISIKVDKEERPDIDAVYMRVCQGFTGSGGWPLTIIMSPEGLPFFAATYLPKQDRYGLRGILSILDAAAEAWKNERKPLIEVGEKIVESLQKEMNPRSSKAKGSHGDFSKNGAKSWHEDFTEQAVKAFIALFDRRNGGFGSRPKFPSPQNLMLLMRYYDLSGDKRFIHIAEKTLMQMYRGGIFDHLGGGFSRYSTDDKWLVPHFEKMLYDNSLLAICYAELFALTEKALYKEVCIGTLDYLINEMSSEERGFYSAQDADSEGEEGKYYVFSLTEIQDVLLEDAAYFAKVYGISESGNFEGKNILNLLENSDFENVLQDERIAKCKEKLLTYRAGRVELHKDKKQLTSWNAMAIAAFAKAGRLLEHEAYINRGEDAAQFIIEYLTTEDGGLKVRAIDGEAAGKGTLDDYAYFGWALTELYDATAKTKYLDRAVEIFKEIKNRFKDVNEDSGFFLTDKDAEQLISRPKEIHDGAVPSGNSVVAFFFSKLAIQTGLAEVKREAQKQISFVSEVTQDIPWACPFAVLGMMMTYSGKSYLCENGMCSI